MRLHRSLFVLFAVLALIGRAPAEPAQRTEQSAPTPPAELAERIAPFVDPQTVAVLHVDLARFDLSALLGFAAPEQARRQSGVHRTGQRLQRGVESLRKEGVRDVFIIVSLADLRGAGPFVIVPNAEKDAVCPIIAEIWAAPEQNVCEERGGTVFYGYPSTWERLSKQRNATQLPLEPAFSAVSEAGLRLVMPVSEEHRRVVREMAPQFSQELEGVRGDDLAAIQWAALGISTQPGLRLRAVVQTNDAEAAASLKKLVTAGLRMLAKMPPVRQAIPGIEDLAGVLSPEVDAERLIVSISNEEQIATLRTVLSRPLEQARGKAVRSARTNDLKQFGLAMHSFHDSYKSFPPAARYEGDKPLLSWRVYVLPFLGEEELYKQFRLDEPWDSERNRKLIEKMPAAFAGPHPELRRDGKTTIVAPVGEKTIFSAKRGTPIRAITDGTSNTILLVSVPPEKAVIWTKPDDLEVDLENPVEGLVGKDDEGFLALFADGSVRFISRKIDPETLRRLLMPSDGKVVGEIP